MEGSVEETEEIGEEEEVYYLHNRRWVLSPNRSRVANPHSQHTSDFRPWGTMMFDICSGSSLQRPDHH